MRQQLRVRIITSVLLVAALTPAGAPANADPDLPGTARIDLSTGTKTGTVREIHHPRPYGLLGLTWQGAAPDTVSVRTESAQGWTDWTPLHTTDGTPTGRGAEGTEPLWTGAHTGVQVRASRDGQDVTDELDLIAVAPDRAATPTALPRQQPPVISRARWGADESQMTWPPEYLVTTKAVTVHHTAGTNDYDCTESAAVVRAIYRYHAVELGWGDIGYHALVDACGSIFEGRFGGMDKHVIGGHAGGFNRYTFGVAMIGSFETTAPSEPMVDSVAAITGWKLDTVGVDPHDDTTLTSTGGGTSKYPRGTEVEVPTVFGHRDVGYTVCPGDAGYTQLERIRDKADSSDSATGN